MVTIDAARQHVGRGVVYVPGHGAREDGVITGVSDHYVFVRFADQHPAAHGKACNPADLEWASRDVRDAALQRIADEDAGLLDRLGEAPR